MFTVATQRNLSRAKDYFKEHLSVNDYYTAEEFRDQTSDHSLPHRQPKE